MTAPSPWRITASTTVIADQWINLRSDACVDARGQTISPYYVLEQNDWITVLAMTEDHQVIAVREYHHGVEVVGLGLVGGGVDRDETPQDATARELLEETGYEATELIDLGSVWANWANQTNRSHHFLAMGCRRVAEQRLDTTELIDVQLVALDGLGEQLAQSYHQLTWFKAVAWLAGHRLTQRS